MKLYEDVIEHDSRMRLSGILCPFCSAVGVGGGGTSMQAKHQNHSAVTLSSPFVAADLAAATVPSLHVLSITLNFAKGTAVQSCYLNGPDCAAAEWKALATSSTGYDMA